MDDYDELIPVWSTFVQGVVVFGGSSSVFLSVFIMDACDELIPVKATWIQRFLPLNISPDTLRQYGLARDQGVPCEKVLEMSQKSPRISTTTVVSFLKHFISRPLNLAVNCLVSLASEHMYADFWEMIPGIVSAFYAPCSAVDTRMASVYEASGNFSHFLRSGGLWEMTSGLSPYSALCLVQQWIHVYVSL